MSQNEQPIADNGAARRRTNQRNNQEYYSTTLSGVVRYLAFGMCGVAFTLLSTDTFFAQLVRGQSTSLLVWVAFLGIVTLIFDYLQLIFGWFAAKGAAENKEHDYKETGLVILWSFIREGAFYIKQITVFFGAALLVYVIANQIWYVTTLPLGESLIAN